MLRLPLTFFLVVLASVGPAAFVWPGRCAAVEQTVTVDLNNVPIGTALSQLLRGTGSSYVLDPGLADRRVTIALRNVPPDQALRATLRLSGLKFTVEDNVYIISDSRPRAPSITGPAVAPPPKPERIVEAAPVEIRVEKIPLNFVDAADIAAVLRCDVVTSRMEPLPLEGSMYGFGRTLGGAYAIPGVVPRYGYGGYGAYDYGAWRPPVRGGW